MDPLVSVIMPVYNGEKVIKKSLDSIIDQTFKDFELIIVDDGSTDSTSAILKEYGPHIVYYRQENHGFSHAISKGISLARGKYLSFIGQDDIYLPQKLKSQVKILEDESACVLAHSSAIFIDENDNELYHWGGYRGIYRWVRKEKNNIKNLFYYLYINDNFIVHPSVMLRKSVLAEFDEFPFDPDLEIGSDYFLYLKLAYKHRFYGTDQPLVKVRRWKNQLTADRVKVFLDERTVIRRIKELFGKGSLRFFFLYRLAMANLYVSEGMRYLLWKKPARAAGLLLISLFYCPLNIGRWMLMGKRACEMLFDQNARKAYGMFLKHYRG
ncbi:glycosyltransferase [Candidatus Omnitrophota bacterium]